MKINDIANSLFSNYSLQRNNDNLNRATGRLSTGKRINSAVDDPSGLAISTQYKKIISGQKTAIQNIKDDLSLLQKQYEGLAQIHELQLRMRDIAVRAGNEATLSPRAYSVLSREMSSLVQEITRTANATLYNERRVLIGVDVGATSTDLEFELEWWRQTDMDMHVIQPDGEHAWYPVPDPNGHGEIDIDNTWGSDGITPALEHYNVATGVALTGNYDLWVNFYWDNTGTGADENVTVTVSMYRGTSAESIQEFNIAVPYQPGDAPYAWGGPPYGEAYVGSFYWEPLTGETEPVMFIGGGEDVSSDIYEEHTFYESRASGLGMSAVSASSASAAQSAIDTIDSAIEKISDHISEVAKHEAFLNRVMDQLYDSNISLSEANSKIEDADMAQEVTNLSSSLVLLNMNAWSKMRIDVLSEAVVSMISQHMDVVKTESNV